MLLFFNFKFILIDSEILFKTSEHLYAAMLKDYRLALHLIINFKLFNPSRISWLL